MTQWEDQTQALALRKFYMMKGHSMEVMQMTRRTIIWQDYLTTRSRTFYNFGSFNVQLSHSSSFSGQPRRCGRVHLLKKLYNLQSRADGMHQGLHFCISTHRYVNIVCDQHVTGIYLRQITYIRRRTSNVVLDKKPLRYNSTPKSYREVTNTFEYVALGS